MATGYEDILTEVEARLTTSVDFVPGTYGTRRGHLTTIPRDAAPGAHIVGGDDIPQKGGRNCGGRQGEFIVSIFTRDDAGSSAADPYVLELYDRLREPFAAGIVVKPIAIHRIVEIADGDAARTDCRFAVTYPTDGEWSLELAAG
jgi:hypothetical protein